MSRRTASIAASISDELTNRASKETVATLVRRSNATLWMPGSFFTSRAILAPQPVQNASGAARDIVWYSDGMAGSFGRQSLAQLAGDQISCRLLAEPPGVPPPATVWIALPRATAPRPWRGEGSGAWVAHASVTGSKDSF